jgi:outer membrane protein TolC
MGTYDYREYNVGGHAFEYTAGVNVSIPVFDSGAIRGQIKTARAVLEQQHESLRAIDIQVKADVRQAMAAWQRAAANVRSGIQLVEAGHESVNTALGLYEAGKATSLDVLTAQSQLALAQSSLLQTRGAYAIAKAQMVRLTGLRDVTTP